jgi:hypothetical protein
MQFDRNNQSRNAASASGENQDINHIGQRLPSCCWQRIRALAAVSQMYSKREKTAGRKKK